MEKVKLSNSIKRKLFGGAIVGMVVANGVVSYAAYKKTTVDSEHYKYCIDLGIEYYEMPGKDHIIYAVGIRGEDVRNGSASVPYDVYYRHPNSDGSYSYKSITDGTLSKNGKVSVSGRKTGLKNNYYDRASISYILNDEEEKYFSEYNSEYKY